MNKSINKTTGKFLPRLQKNILACYIKVLSYYLVYFARKNIYNFKDVQTMVLTIGFPRSGSSLIGFLLTAHPNIVIPDEATVDPMFVVGRPIRTINKLKRPETHFLFAAELDEIFDYLLCADRLRYILGTSIFNSMKNQNLNRGRDRTRRYLYIPNQYQGRFQSLQVIGNKCSQSTVNTLAKKDILKNFRSKLEDKKISLKFIFNIRNPYDMVATDIRECQYNKIMDYMGIMTGLCENNMKILQQTDPDDVFICKNEDMIENPKLQLTKLCDFLNVSTSGDYINACTSRVLGNPTKSRFEIDWSDKHKQKVASLIQKYDFFSGYDW